MNTSIHSPSTSKNIHKASRLVDVLLALMLSWAAMDHLLGPKDVVDTMRRLSLSTRMLVKSIVVYPLTVLQGMFAYLPIRDREHPNETSISMIHSSFQSL